MDQIPVAAPIPQACNVPPTGEPQMVIAMMMVTMAPMITASQAVTRMIARSTSNNARGSSATKVLTRIELLSEIRCGKKHGRQPSAALACAAPVPCSAIGTIVTHIPDVFNRQSSIHQVRAAYPIRHTVVCAQARVVVGAQEGFLPACGDVAAVDDKSRQRTASPIPDGPLK